MSNGSTFCMSFATLFHTRFLKLLIIYGLADWRLQRMFA